MFSNGTLLQPCLGTRQGSDFLSTKSAVTCVTTANIRARERLIRETTSLEKEKHYICSSYDYKKNMIKMRMEKIKKQADAAKEKRRIAEEKRKKEEEEREKKKKKAKSTTAFSGGFKAKANSTLNIDQNALAELLEELNLEGGESFDEFTDDTTQVAEDGYSNDGVHVEKTTGKSLSKRVTFSDGTPPGGNNPTANNIGPVAKLAVAKMKLLAKQSAKDKNADPQKQGTRSSSRSSSRSGGKLNPELIKMLAQRLAGSDKTGNNEKMSEEQKKVLQLLTQGGQDNQSGGGLRTSLHRMLTQAHLKNVGLGLIKDDNPSGWLPVGRGRRHDPEKEARRDKFLKPYYVQSYALPPISTMEPPQFTDRNIDKLDEPTQHPELTEEEWESLRHCRYIRFSKKFYTQNDIVCLDVK